MNINLDDWDHIPTEKELPSIIGRLAIAEHRAERLMAENQRMHRVLDKASGRASKFAKIRVRLTNAIKAELPQSYQSLPGLKPGDLYKPPPKGSPEPDDEDFEDYDHDE